MQLLGSLQIEHEFELVRPLDRQVARLYAAQDFSHQLGATFEQ